MQSFDADEFWSSIKSEDSPHWPVVCVDLNGVLDEYKGWTGKVEAYPVAKGAREFLEELRDYFNTIVVFTATIPVQFAEMWLIENDLDFLVDFCTNHKVPAQVYIDDRAVCHRGNFKETLEQVKTFNPHWRKNANTR